MTDQKRDESTKCYPPIQSDPARRIRRIQRWLETCGDMMPAAAWIYPCVANARQWDTADALFATELAWLCVYSHHQSCTIAEQKARIEELVAQNRRLSSRVDELRFGHGAEWEPEPTD